MNINYSIHLISNKPHLFSAIEKSIAPENVNYFDGTGYPSFSKLVNACTAAANTEIVIILSDKVLPKAEHVNKVITLLEKGYGFVGLYRFAFFAFKKELFRQIGPMDERFVGGGYEDDDFYIRLKEANIAMYVTEELEYEKASSSWDQSTTVNHFIAKWIPNHDPNIKLKHNIVSRRIPEPNHTYNFGPAVPTAFLSWGEHTYAPPSKASKYTTTKGK